MKFIRFLWIVTFILFIIPFLGFPQGFKDFLIILCALFLGFMAWFRGEKIKYRRKMMKSAALQEQDNKE